MIKHKYIYQNLMSDKIDFCNKHPNLKLRLPQRKILGGNQYDYDVTRIKPNLDGFVQKPCKFDFDYKHLASKGDLPRLDAAKLPLGKHLEIGVDPSRELDRLDKQLFEWNIQQEAKNRYKGDGLRSSKSEMRLIPDEYRHRNDLKTDYLM